MSKVTQKVCLSKSFAVKYFDLLFVLRTEFIILIFFLSQIALA